MKVTRKDFGVQSQDDCMQSQRCKDKYSVYQAEYRNEFGVFPELDKINNPLTALFDEPYDAYREFMKRGFWGDLWYHDIHSKINKQIKKFYHRYKKEWSFWISAGVFSEILNPDICSVEPRENIVNNLGVRVDENGDYYEGTWNNGSFEYGLIYFSKSDTWFIGSVERNKGGKTIYDGMVAVGEKTSKNTSEFKLIFGKHLAQNGNIGPYEGVCMLILSKFKNESLIYSECEIGNFDEGYMHGKFLNKTITDDNRAVGVSKYKDGALQNSSNAGFMVLHFFMAWYMMLYFLYKYLIFWPIVVISRASKKKQWK